MTNAEAIKLEAEGASFSRVVDESDPRFEIITWRRLTAASIGGPPVPDRELRGHDARRYAIGFMLATSAGLAQLVGEPNVARSCRRLAEMLGVLARSQ